MQLHHWLQKSCLLNAADRVHRPSPWSLCERLDIFLNTRSGDCVTLALGLLGRRRGEWSIFVRRWMLPLESSCSGEGSRTLASDAKILAAPLMSPSEHFSRDNAWNRGTRGFLFLWVVVTFGVLVSFSKSLSCLLTTVARDLCFLPPRLGLERHWLAKSSNLSQAWGLFSLITRFSRDVNSFAACVLEALGILLRIDFPMGLEKLKFRATSRWGRSWVVSLSAGVGAARS